MSLMKLFPYQEQGVQYLQARTKALLFDDPGLGKTAQALSALTTCAVVVCPASVKQVWAAEAAKFAPQFRVTQLSGRKSFRWPDADEIVVTNYEILPPEALSPSRPVTLIADEAHRLKTPKSLQTKRFRALKTLVLQNCGRVWGLTGTPLLTHPPDLWNVLQSFDMAADAYGRFDHFRYLFSGVPAPFGGFFWGKPKPGAASNLANVALGRKREQVLPSLPTKIYETYNVVLPKTEMEAAERGVDLESVLKVLAGGVDITTVSRYRAELARYKALHFLEYLAELEQEGNQLVVFSAHTEACRILASQGNRGLFIGDTTETQRRLLVEDFQAGKLRTLVGSVGAMGVGLTLTAANRVIFIDRSWTPAMNTQAEDRVCRIGQTRGVIITDVLSQSKIDSEVLKNLRQKQNILDASVESARTHDSQSAAYGI